LANIKESSIDNLIRKERDSSFLENMESKYSKKTSQAVVAEDPTKKSVTLLSIL
jgi:hypothetical protein